MASPDLADLDAFAAVARARGFRGAAVGRGVSPSSLSEAVRRLETALGVRLLNRTTRSVTATEAGERLLERLAPALAEVAGALDTMNQFRDSPTGTLKLNVPGAAAKLALGELIGPFLRAHPGVTLEIIVEDSFIDVLAAGADAGVRYGERLEKDMIAVPLSGPERYQAAASPDFLARYGVPRHPRDLLTMPCIRHRFPSGAMIVPEFEKDGEIIRVSPEGPLVTSSSELEIRAAEEGLGVVMSFEGLLAPAVAAGRLVPVLEDWNPPFDGPFLYYPSRRHMPAPLRAFVDFLRARRTGTPAGN
ncbi:MAG: LysR family transcriptional regulator [Caulobacter sp.]